MQDDLIRRALAAYFRTGGMDQPAIGDSEVVSVDRLQYVRLANVNGTLAVYRVDTVGRLKRLKRWPCQLDALAA